MRNPPLRTVIAAGGLTALTGLVAIGASRLGPSTVPFGSSGRPSQTASDRLLVTRAQFDGWMTELSNWGRWGPDDELGALNLVTPAKKAEAARLVTEGLSVSLASNAQKEQTVDNPCPVAWEMVRATRTGASDTIAYPCIHGPGTTHLDAFAHIFFDGKMWNGYDVEDLVTMEDGAAKGSILNMKHGIVTRGVLYDIARLKGVPYLQPGERFFVEDLEAWEAQTGVRVGPGDAMIIRWGRWARQAALGPFDTGLEAAGPDNSIIPWLRERDVAVIGWETPGYVPVPEGDELGRLAVHNFALTMLGVQLIDRGDFDALAEAAAERGRWEFMLTIAPLPIPNGTGSPVNPIAMF